jgi:hypothetical protein
MSSSSETAVSASRQYPRQALSKATSRRLLRELLRRAEDGDNAAAEALVRLARESRGGTAPTRTE